MHNGAGSYVPSLERIYNNKRSEENRQVSGVYDPLYIPQARIVRQFNIQDMGTIEGDRDLTIVDSWNDYINAFSQSNVGLGRVYAAGSLAVSYFRQDTLRDAMKEYRSEFSGERPDIKKLRQAFYGLSENYSQFVDQNADKVYQAASKDCSDQPASSRIALPWHHAAFPMRQILVPVEGSATKLGVPIHERFIRVFTKEFELTRSFLLGELGKDNQAIRSARLEHTEVTLVKAYFDLDRVDIEMPTRKRIGSKGKEVMPPPSEITLLPPQMVVIERKRPQPN